MAQRICQTCGVGIEHRFPTAKFCSKRCGAKVHVATYKSKPGWTRTTWPGVCETCGIDFLGVRKTTRFCSEACKGLSYRTKCKLPPEHPVMQQIAERRRVRREAAAERRRAKQRAAEEKRQARRARWVRGHFDERVCGGCGRVFCPLLSDMVAYCSDRCQSRAQRRRRRRLEAGAAGAGWTDADFMRVAQKFGYRCAYCGGLDEIVPDHVVPLSRGGDDSPTNLLPACVLCNSSKLDHTLGEWALLRQGRGQEPRATSWPPSDRRYWHLTQVGTEKVRLREMPAQMGVESAPCLA